MFYIQSADTNPFLKGYINVLRCTYPQCSRKREFLNSDSEEKNTMFL